MTIVALALLAVLALTVALFAGLLRSVHRSYARERDLILNQLLHVTGKTWIAPPAEAPAVSDASPAAAREKVIRFVDSPEQFPAAV